ncbi:MAG: hypothetical protein ABF274_09065 [Nonlabens sp.]|jgi:hypothetical protein|uniref:hypothetical protein n=1 Tax=Nonlabens sp. TaxID=1888209 RepID=UPI00321B00A1
MIRYKVLWICCVLAFAKAELSKAQSTQKIEREEKIDAIDFPKNALQTVEEIGYSRKKVKFYRETDGDKTSYEAKLKYKGSKYSIEFNQNGILEDVEIDLPKREIPKETRTLLNRRLDTIARKYRIEKVQLQYLNKGQTSLEIQTRIDRKDFDNYEIIVAFKDKRKIYRKEILFDNKGAFIQERDIKRQEYDFILF